MPKNLKQVVIFFFSKMTSLLISLEATRNGQNVQLKCFDMSESEVNHLFGKDRVTKNGVYFDATLPDVAPHGWALRRHQLMKAVEKSTRALFLSFGSVSNGTELWVFRRTEAPLNASFASAALISPRPSSPDTSSSHLSASGSLAASAANSSAANASTNAADDDSNEKDTHHKSAAKPAADPVESSPRSPAGSATGKKKKSKPKSPKSDDE